MKTMSKKQGSTKQKSLSAGKARRLERKSTTWTIAFRPATHSKKLSIPLGFAVRNLLEASKNMKETKFILTNNKVTVDGIVRKSRNFSLGLFDLLELKDLKKTFRIVLDTNGRLALHEIKAGEKPFKLCKIASKKAVKQGSILLSTNDGRSFLEKQTGLKPGDSVKIQIPEQKIMKELKLEAGSIVLLLSGKHVGRTAKVAEIIQGTLRKEKTLTLEMNGEQFQTTANNVFVIGSEKPEIEVLKED